LLADFERVFIFADGDQPGMEFARSLARELPVTIIQLPDGTDVNSIYVQEGSQYFHQKVGLSEL
jgi:DNA primase